MSEPVTNRKKPGFATTFWTNECKDVKTLKRDREETLLHLYEPFLKKCVDDFRRKKSGYHNVDEHDLLQEARCAFLCQIRSGVEPENTGLLRLEIRKALFRCLAGHLSLSISPNTLRVYLSEKKITYEHVNNTVEFTHALMDPNHDDLTPVHVTEYIQSLPKRSADVVLLRMKGFMYTEISMILGISYNAVRYAVEIARQMSQEHGLVPAIG